MANEFVLFQNIAYRKENIEKFWHREESGHYNYMNEEWHKYFIVLAFTDGNAKEFRYDNKEEWEKDFMNLFNDINK